MLSLWKRLCLFGIFLLVGSCWSDVVEATRARKHALNDSPFFFDDTDVFLYPGTLVHHNNKLIVEGQSSPFEGSASAIYGDGFVLGIFGNRPATFNDIGATTSLYGLSQNLTLPRRLFDLMGGIRLPGGGSLGVGLSFSTMLFGENNASTTSRNNRTTGNQTLSFEVLLGYSLRRRKMSLDVGLEFTFNNYKIVEADTVQQEGSAVPSFSIRSRFFYNLTRDFELGVDLVLARRHYALATPSNQSSAAYGYFLLEALIGPRVAISIPRPFSITESRNGLQKNGSTGSSAPASNGNNGGGKLPIQAYFTGGLLLGYQSLSGSNTLQPNGLRQSQLEQAAGSLLFPGFHAALEAMLWQYLIVRMGFSARFFFANASSRLPGFPNPVNPEEPSNTTPATQNNTQQIYSWAAGIGVNFGGFRIDGSFEVPLFTQGPNFIGGKQPGLFAVVSLSYAWR